MAENTRRPPAPSGNRIRLLTDTYRGIHARYAEIAELSEAQRALLAEGGAIGNVNALLRRKKEILREIRVEEERVMGAREWWKKIRRTLAPERSRELLSLLDSISRRVERILELEADCRERLSRKTAWGGNGQTSAPPRAGWATDAYRRQEPAASARGDLR